jgi:general secretion pathway protein A
MRPTASGTSRDVAELLRVYAGETTTDNAFRNLFALWGGQFDPRAGRPCTQALQQGLQCAFQQGTWAQLRTLNRPAILTLFDAGGNEHQVTMASVDSGLAIVNLNNQRHTVSVASVTKLWSGDYLVLWRPQVASQRSLSQGMQGASVRWLRRSLLTLQGRPNTNASDYYDADLMKMVEEFQRKYRLPADGVAGVQTQIVVDMLNNPAGAPLLAKASSG